MYVMYIFVQFAGMVVVTDAYLTRIPGSKSHTCTLYVYKQTNLLTCAAMINISSVI